jgi:NAD(P)-dependent dehydrogenase (short-subunit alcohol dehydrogenase family)
MNGMDGKICLVTGATSGIGLATARELVMRGATVVLVGRNPKKCKAEVEKLRRACGEGRADFILADLSCQGDVRNAAREFKERYERLDVLVNNAGAYFVGRSLSVDGLEMTFALNHLAYFLLTHLLLELLKASKTARIVTVASSAHQNGKIDFDDLQGEKHYDWLEAYAQSKLANLLFTYALDRRLRGSNVTANALHPGAVSTGLGSNNSWLKAKLRNLLKPGYISPEKGARTSVYLASAPEVQGVSGRYFFECRELRSSECSYSQSDSERLWLLSEIMTGIRPAQGSNPGHFEPFQS